MELLGQPNGEDKIEMTTMTVGIEGYGHRVSTYDTHRAVMNTSFHIKEWVRMRQQIGIKQSWDFCWEGLSCASNPLSLMDSIVVHFNGTNNNSMKLLSECVKDHITSEFLTNEKITSIDLLQKGDALPEYV